MNIKRILAVSVILVGFLIAGIIFSGNDGYSDAQPVGETVASTSARSSSSFRAPDFTLPDVDGKKVSLSDYEGSIVIINFWTTWCGPCRYEIPDLMELREKYDGDLVVIGISLDYDPASVVPRFVEKLGINYPILYGDTSIAGTYGGVSGIPTTFVIDRDMNLYRRYIGYRPQSVFEKDIEDLI
ncbi:MAG: TlpA disulfide reductase family protein [Candidatus Neomarinimicrobiota bacterium]|nr:TlpA disulfide reductase family protein [Candidatus Neomarinimicrobiota bacterium]